MWSNLTTRAKLVIMGLVVFVVLAVAAAVWQLNSDAQNPGTTGQYVDPVSGETVSSPDGKAPDKYGTEGQPIFLGFSKLLDRVSKFQVAGLKVALTNFSKTSHYTQYSIDPKTISVVMADRNSLTARDMVKFRLVADKNTELQATMEFYEISKIRLYLTDSNNKAVFDSSDINGNTITD